MKNKKVCAVKEKYYGYSLPIRLKQEQTIIEEEIQDVTVCLVLDGKGNFARGVTVFNREEDVYNEVVGREQAKHYAIRALKGREMKKNEFEREPALKTLIRTKCPFTKKGERNINLSMYERSLLFGKNFQEKYKVPAFFGNVLEKMWDIEKYNLPFIYGDYGSGRGASS